MVDRSPGQARDTSPSCCLRLPASQDGVRISTERQRSQQEPRTLQIERWLDRGLGKLAKVPKGDLTISDALLAEASVKSEGRSPHL
jgi:hypothetical protein